MIRYHEDIIHKRRKGVPQQQHHSPGHSKILYVEGVSKNINEIRVGLPDRKDRIQQ